VWLNNITFNPSDCLILIMPKGWWPVKPRGCGMQVRMDDVYYGSISSLSHALKP
jgi:hypothetical protein